MRENGVFSKNFSQSISKLLNMSFKKESREIEEKLAFFLKNNLSDLIACYENDPQKKLKYFLAHPKLFSFWDEQLPKLYDKQPEPVFYSFDLILGCYYFAMSCDARKKEDTVTANMLLKKSEEKNSAYFWVTFISHLLQDGEKNQEAIIKKAEMFGQTHGSVGYYFLAAMHSHMINFFPLEKEKKHTEKYEQNEGIRRLHYLRASAYLAVGDTLSEICQNSIGNISEEGLFNKEKLGYSNFEGLIKKCKKDVSYMNWTKEESTLINNEINNCVTNFKNQVERFSEAKKEEEIKSQYASSRLEYI